MKRMKLIKNRGIASVTAFSLALALTVTSVLGSSLGTLTVRAAGGTLSGSGTVEDPYIIEDADDLWTFANMLRGSTSHLSDCAKIADGVTMIDVSDEMWQGIPSNMTMPDGYRGTFDGNGATIKLTMAISGGYQVGFFNTLDAGGVIKNVTIDGTVSGNYDVGGVCGRNGGTIIDCNNKADVSGKNDRVGGIAGSCMDGGKLIAFKTMSNSGQIEAGSRVGGIVGYCSKASIEGDGELLNTGMVHSRDVYAGGIIGKAETKTSVKIAGAAKNTADINGSGYAGGIIGQMTSSDLLQIQAGSILNAGSIYCSGEHAGGIVGAYDGNIEITAATGDIQNTGYVQGTKCIGGFVGATYMGTITAAGNMINTGEVNASDIYIGGIIGRLQDTQVVSVKGEIRNEGNVGGNSAMGGIVGYATDEDAKIPVMAYGDIVNQGKLQGTISSGSASVGGILGSFDCQEGIFSETGVIKNEGDITANGTMVGGIGGYYAVQASTKPVQKCINTGSVTGTNNVGGLFGTANLKSSTEEYKNIENSYSTGSVTASGESQSKVGALVGYYAGNKIKNSYHTSLYPITGTADEANGVENCYDIEEYRGVAETEEVISKTKAEFASGEVAYLLDGTGENRATAPVWGQNIGTDESPVLGGATVYKDGDIYANAEHTYGDATYKWSDDKKSCAAKATCQNCNSEQTETAQAAYSVKRQATEKEEGVGLYTAVFKNGLFTTQTAEVKIAKLTPKPSQPTNPSNPSNPTKPSDPSKPTNPSNPTKPTNNKKKPAAKGTTLKDSKGATYKVTGAKVKNPTVTYVKPKKNVKKVSIPATITVKGMKYQVTAVSKDAFKNNKKVTQVTIDKNVNNIGKNAFYGCKNLKKITIKTTKLTKKTVGKNAFKGIHKKATIKVPKKKLDVYKKLLKNAGISKSVKVVKM